MTDPARHVVMIVNESFARRIEAAGAVIGRSLLLDDHEFQIVGVVRDYQEHTAGQAAPSMVFVPFWQNDFEPQIDARLAVRLRGGGDPRSRMRLSDEQSLRPTRPCRSRKRCR